MRLTKKRRETIHINRIRKEKGKITLESRTGAACPTGHLGGVAGPLFPRSRAEAGPKRQPDLLKPDPGSWADDPSPTPPPQGTLREAQGRRRPVDLLRQRISVSCRQLALPETRELVISFPVTHQALQTLLVGHIYSSPQLPIHCPLSQPSHLIPSLLKLNCSLPFSG